MEEKKKKKHEEKKDLAQKKVKVKLIHLFTNTCWLIKVSLVWHYTSYTY